MVCVTVWFDFYISRTLTLLANLVFYSFSLFDIAKLLDEPLSQKEMIMASLTKSVLPADPGHSIVFSWVLAALSGVGGQRVCERSCWHCIEKNILSAGCQMLSLHIFAASMQITIIGYFDTAEHNRNICNFLLWHGRTRTSSLTAFFRKLNKISGGALCIGSVCCCSSHFRSLNKMCLPVCVPLSSHSGCRESRWSHGNWV